MIFIDVAYFSTIVCSGCGSVTASWAERPSTLQNHPAWCHWDTDEEVTTKRLLAGSFEQV